jgi:hypothetical protein
MVVLLLLLLLRLCSLLIHPHVAAALLALATPRGAGQGDVAHKLGGIRKQGGLVAACGVGAGGYNCVPAAEAAPTLAVWV